MNVPKLRFPEFRAMGERNVYELGEIATFHKGKGLPKSELNLLGTSPCVHYGQLFTEYAEVIDSVISKTNSNGSDYFKSVKNDVLMPTSDVTPKGLAKASCINLDDVILGGDILVIRTNPKQVYGAFLSRFIRHNEHEILKLVSGSTVFHLYGSALAKMQVVLPSFQEQRKIAACLSSLDELVTAETQTLEAYKQHKKGLMQQLFPQTGETTPRLRFPEFRELGEWNVHELGEIATFYKGKGLPKSELNLLGTNACVHYGQLFTEYAEVIDSVISKTNSNGGGYFKSVKNDVLMPTSDVTPKGLAKASCINLDDVILGGDILVIRTNPKQVHGAFLSRFIRHKEHEVLKLVSGSTVFHLYGSALAKIQVVLPPFQEQQKIANCFSSLDDLIAAQTRKIDVLKTHKKGLMQGLFPNPSEEVQP
jgi:type I restriction enzyme S subunit